MGGGLGPRQTHCMTSRLRTLLFLATAIPLGALGASVLLAGWLVVLLLAVTPLVVPALVGFRAAVGGLAWVESRLANVLLGTSVEPELTSHARGYWRRGLAVLEREAFWAQQVYLLQRFVLGGVYAIAELSLLFSGASALTFPLWYRWSDTTIGSWHVDTIGQALLWVPAGAIALLLGIWLLGPIRSLSRSLAFGLLGRRGAVQAPSSRGARRGLAVHVAVAAIVNAIVLIVWAAVPHTAFWPVWTLLSTALVVALHACVVLVGPGGLRLHAAIGASLVAFFFGVWAAAGRGYPWPVWTLAGLAITLAAHRTLQYATQRSRRISELEATRSGIVVQQDSELRRIERDLHDGAQATLVALGMSIGMAEQKLASDPDAAQALLAEARRGAQDALRELRDLARGIHPPVLADRGLGAAVAALAARSRIRIESRIDLPARPPEAVETAAYFVVAESLANIGKHAQAGTVSIDVHEAGDAVVVRVEDDGRGGADPNGSGLLGLARRVAAFDGTFTVSSPPGGPTIVEAVLPCAR